MKFQPPDLQKFQHVCGPKVSKGRSESPLVAPGGVKSPALAGAQTCKSLNTYAARRFPKGDQKALWLRLQARNLLRLQERRLAKVSTRMWSEGFQRAIGKPFGRVRRREISCAGRNARKNSQKTKQKPLTTVGSGESRFFAMLDAKPRYFLFCPFTQAKPFLNEGIQR